MFAKRPRSPRGTMWFGIGFLVVGGVSAFLAYQHPGDVSRLGIPIWLLSAIILATGAYYTACGVLWMRRDR